MLDGTPTAHAHDSGPLTVTIDPSRGAKITSLVDASGGEWLLSPRTMEAQNLRDASFTDAEMGGWDECAPSVVACHAPDGREIPDHGDLWNIAWAQSNGSLTGIGSSIDYRLTRTVSATRTGARIDYTVVAREDTPWLWAAHPQFLATPGTRVLLDTGHVVDVLHDPPAVRDWPGGLDSIESLAPGTGRKVYADPATPIGSATLERPGYGSLRMTWDSSVAPYVGLWFDNRAFARQPVIALEPSTGFFDSLEKAAAEGRVLHLRANVPVHWSICLAIDTPTCDDRCGRVHERSWDGSDEQSRRR